jgi:hypothetical protein
LIIVEEEETQLRKGTSGRMTDVEEVSHAAHHRSSETNGEV